MNFKIADRIRRLVMLPGSEKCGGKDPRLEKMDRIYGGAEGDLGKWGRTKEYIRFQNNLADLIIDNGLLSNDSEHPRKRVLSVSANSGLGENILQQRLKDQVKVIVADLVIPKTRYEEGNRILHDARRLPIRCESTDILIDTMGALWYEGTERGGDMRALLEEYLRVLDTGGLLVIDKSTDAIIETFLGLYDSNFMQEKFEEFGRFGADKANIVVYKKRQIAE